MGSLADDDAEKPFDSPVLAGGRRTPVVAPAETEGTEGTVVVRPSTRADIGAQLGEAVRAVVARAYG